MATITTTTPPENLTGWTVTVPEGWSATAGYGQFSVEGTMEYNNNVYPMYSLNIGYCFGTTDGETFGLLPRSDIFDIDRTYNLSGNSPIFTITGGDNVATPALIQWFVDNNATFAKEGEEKPETPTNSGMKLEVLYKGEVIGSLSAGESIALHLNGQKLTEDLFVRAVVEEIPKLLAPTLSISGDIISITNNNDVGVGYEVYVNGELAVTITATNSTAVDMSGLNLEAGTYSVYLVAVLDGYENSEQSNTVEYVVEEESGVPTNLTGYTVTVPAGWSASMMDFQIGLTSDAWFECNGYPGTGIGVGYSVDFTEFPNQIGKANAIAVASNAGIWLYAFSNSSELTFTFLDNPYAISNGYYSDNELIQWFVDNNATFEKTA